MPIVIKEKKKLKVDKPKRRLKKEESKGGGPLMTPGQKKFLDKQTGKGKPEEAKSGKFMKAADGKITKLRKETSPKAKLGNFRNIVNAAVSGKMSPEKAEKAIKKIVISKAMGGLNSGLKDIPPENKGLPKLPKEVRNKMGFKKKGGTMKMKLGGVARGGGAATSGTGFKGVY